MNRGSPVVAVLAIGLPFAIGAAIVGQRPPPVDEVLRFTDPAIVESSGLVAQDGLLYTTNDSGDVGQVFAVDPETGDTVGTTTWAREPEDVEALAPAGDGEVWVGDIGDNGARREEIAVTRVPVGRGDREAAGTTYRLAYPDGAHDAETLLAHPRTGRLVVVTKGVLGGEAYVAPRRLDPEAVNRLRRVGPVLAVATDGSFLPGGTRIVLRSYGRAVVYDWPSLAEVAERDLPRQPQGEGLALGEDCTLLLSSEGRRQPVLTARLPTRAG